MSTAAAFRLPVAGETPVLGWCGGLTRDAVRMLVAAPDLLAHRRVLDLPDVLHPGDLLVVNTSATLPAAVGPVRVSTQLDDGDWVVEVRRPGNDGPAGTTPGAVLQLPGGVDLHVRGPHPAGQVRLWRATPHPATDRSAYLTEHGRPVTYPYVDGDWPLESRQNVYATVPGSAEMPSAGRPLTERVLVALMARGSR